MTNDQTDQKKMVPSYESLGWLEQIYFEEGYESAMKALEEATPDARLSAFQVIRSGAGAQTVRPEITTQDAIAYTNYSPPPLWAAPFSLLRMTLQHVPKEDTYVVHHGEELVVPITGSVMYAFFWSPGGKAPKRELVTVDPGNIAAVNPRLPHHGWAAKKEKTEAWVAIYHDPDSSTALDIETKIGAAQEGSRSRRRFHSSDFSNPAQFALVAWGIADKIRNQRQRADLTIAQMAKLADIDASHLSRIENASTNVSLEMLLHICKLLRVNLDGLIGASRWNYRIHKLSDELTPSEDWLIADGKSHLLRPSMLKMDATPGGSQKYQVLARQEDLVSWIVLDGRMILEAMSKSTDSDDPTNKAELLEPGAVVHFRKRIEVKVQALGFGRILRIALSRSTG